MSSSSASTPSSQGELRCIGLLLMLAVSTCSVAVSAPIFGEEASATRGMPATGRLAVAHCKNTIASMRRELVTFHWASEPVVLNSPHIQTTRLRCLGYRATDGVSPATTQSSSSSIWWSLSETNSRSGYLTSPSMNGIAGWSTSSKSTNKEDTLNTYNEWNSKAWHVLSQFIVLETVQYHC